MLFFLLTLIPAICFACGNILEKTGLSAVAHTVSIKKPFAFIRLVLKNKYWWTGFALSAVANIGYYLAMALYDISLVQPMMTLNPVLTALFGFWFLKEHLTKRIVAAIAFVFFGLLLSASHAGESSSVQNTSDLWVFAGVIVLVALLFKVFHSQEETSDSLIMGVGFGVSAAFYKSMTLSFGESMEWTSVELLKWAFDPRLWAFLITYMTAFIYSQIAFTRGRALFIIPFSAALGAAIPILAGAFVFSESFSLEKTVSIIFVLLGSALFIIRRPRKNAKRSLSKNSL